MRRAFMTSVSSHNGLVAIQPKSFKPRTTESRHKLGYSPNLLLEGIEIERINQVWVGQGIQILHWRFEQQLFHHHKGFSLEPFFRKLLCR